MSFPSVVLVAPPISDEQWGENLGLASLAAVLRSRGIEVCILDAYQLRLSEQETLERVLAGRPDVVGFQVLQSLSGVVGRLVKALKDARPHLPVLVGGHFPTLATDVCLQLIPADMAVVGEGEETLVEVIEFFAANGTLPQRMPGTAWREGHGVVSLSRQPIEDLDALPFPARDWLPFQLQHLPVAHLVSSRGCYGNCTFCSIRAFYGKPLWRCRTAENVIEEIDRLQKDFQVEVFGFEDDNFIGPPPEGPERARQFAEALLKKGIKIKFGFACRADDVDPELFSLLKRAGMTAVVVGIETFDATRLGRFRKGTTPEVNRKALSILEDLGVNCEPSMILADPYTTLESLRADIEELKGTSYRFTGTGFLTPWYGTPLWQHVRSEGFLAGTVEKPMILYRDPRVSRSLEFIRNTLRPCHVVERIVNALEVDLYREIRSCREHGSVETQNLVAEFKKLREEYRKAKIRVHEVVLATEDGLALNEAKMHLQVVVDEVLSFARGRGIHVEGLLARSGSEDLLSSSACQQFPGSATTESVSAGE